MSDASFATGSAPRLTGRTGSLTSCSRSTKDGGGRKAISLGGAATGFGADLIIVDDLVKAADAASPTERERVKTYYEQTLLSRLNDKVNGRIVAIQRRLHEDDLAGYLSLFCQFDHLNLPAFAVREEHVAIGFGQTHLRRKDDVLCPEREPREALERLRREMGSFGFSAQYQQDPTPPGGNRLRWAWLGTHDAPLPRDTYQFIVQSWDTALSSETSSDFSVGVTAGLYEGNWHILEAVRERLDFPDLKSRVRGRAMAWNADLVLIEKAGSGLPLLQQLRLDEQEQGGHRGHRYISVTPRLDKRMRFEAQTAWLEAGGYLLPGRAPWLEAFRRELLAFPAGRYDDQVDAFIQFVDWSRPPRVSAFVDRDPVSGRRSGLRRH